MQPPAICPCDLSGKTRRILTTSANQTNRRRIIQVENIEGCYPQSAQYPRLRTRMKRTKYAAIMDNTPKTAGDIILRFHKYNALYNYLSNTYQMARTIWDDPSTSRSANLCTSIHHMMPSPGYLPNSKGSVTLTQHQFPAGKYFPLTSPPSPSTAT